MFSLVTVLIIGAIILLYIFVIRDNSRWSVIALGNPNSFNNVSEFSDSRMHLNSNGTFTIELIRNDTPLLTGIGTWTRSGNTYTFNYLDKWINAGAQMIQLGPRAETYERTGMRIRFVDTEGNIFYWR